MMRPGAVVVTAVSKSLGFIRRQPHDWKVTVARISLHRFIDQMVFPYRSVYIVALGATGTQLGIVNSVGMSISGLLALPTGWLIDHIGVKRIYLIGIALLATSYLAFSIAQSWTVIILAMIAYWMGFTTSIHACSTVCGNCLTSADRVTGMTICESLAAGLLGMAGPMLGAVLVTRFGGVNVTGIRPLFFISLVVTVGTFFLILAQLSNTRWGKKESGFNLFQDLYQVFRQGRHLKRWLVIAAITHLPMGMVFPFSPVFAHEIKGADQYVLGAMVTGCALTSLIMGIPLGILADRIGRKKALYLIMPLFWISNLVLIWAPSPALLIVAGVLQGFFYISTPVTQAMARELVPPEQMGRWLGIIRFFQMLLSASLSFVSGVIWDKVGPQYLFLIVIGLDLFVRVPLLLGMPETLHLRAGREIKAV